MKDEAAELMAKGAETAEQIIVKNLEAENFLKEESQKLKDEAENLMDQAGANSKRKRKG